MFCQIFHKFYRINRFGGRKESKLQTNKYDKKRNNNIYLIWEKYDGTH